jgi:hypothetical protein
MAHKDISLYILSETSVVSPINELRSSCARKKRRARLHVECPFVVADCFYAKLQHMDTFQ